MFKTHPLDTSLNAHIFAVRKDNLFKFSVIVHISLVFLFFAKIPLLTFIAIRSPLSDLCPYVFFRQKKVQMNHQLNLFLKGQGLEGMSLLKPVVNDSHKSQIHLTPHRHQIQMMYHSLRCTRKTEKLRQENRQDQNHQRKVPNK